MLDEIVRLEAEVESLRNAMEVGRQQQRDFARRAGHDLAAPLRGLRNLTSFLREDAAGSLDTDALDLLDRIDTRVLQMERVLTSLVMYARSSDAETSLTAVELLPLVEDAIQAASPPAGFNTTIDVPAGHFHLPAASGARCLERIFENSWHHHDDRDGRVSITATNGDGRITFVVADDGPGIDDLVAAQAFEPLRAGPPAPVSGDRRAGMGLAIASATASAHGATIAIAHHRPRGTVVELGWPLVCPLPLA